MEALFLVRVGGVIPWRREAGKGTARGLFVF
jgi:hypothetical protein